MVAITVPEHGPLVIPEHALRQAHARPGDELVLVVRKQRDPEAFRRALDAVIGMAPDLPPFEREEDDRY
jgi:hypothetical protein